METGRGLPATDPDEPDSTQSKGQGCFTGLLRVLDSLKVKMGARADSQRANERCLRRTGTGRLLSESRQEFGDFGPTLTPGCTFESLLGEEEERKVKN